MPGLANKEQLPISSNKEGDKLAGAESAAKIKEKLEKAKDDLKELKSEVKKNPEVGNKSALEAVANVKKVEATEGKVKDKNYDALLEAIEEGINNGETNLIDKIDNIGQKEETINEIPEEESKEKNYDELLAAVEKSIETGEDLDLVKTPVKKKTITKTPATNPSESKGLEGSSKASNEGRTTSANVIKKTIDESDKDPNLIARTAGKIMKRINA